jgi:hypothetical protein
MDLTNEELATLLALAGRLAIRNPEPVNNLYDKMYGQLPQEVIERADSLLVSDANNNYHAPLLVVSTWLGR